MVAIARKHKIIFTTIAAIVVASVATYIYLCQWYKTTTYDMRFYNQSLSSERMLIRYYDSLRYFPHTRDEYLDFVHKHFYSDMRKEDIRAREMYGDLLSRHGGEIAYIPLYDYKTKVAVSFIFLSAGIDGKMDNKLSPTDTLYTNTWWKDLDVYNYGESVLIHHHWEMYKKNRKTFNEEKFWKYYPPYPALEPRFSIIKYLFGKKDWVIQTDLIDYDKDPIQSASPAFPED